MDGARRLACQFRASAVIHPRDGRRPQRPPRPRREFGKLPQWFTRGGSAPWAAPLREAFAAFVAKQDDVRTTKSIRKNLGLPATAASRNLTKQRLPPCLASPYKMATLAEAGGPLPAQAIGARGYIASAAGPGSRAPEAQSQYPHQRRAALGIGHEVVLHLLERGVLTEVPMDARIDCRRMISVQNIEDLVERMRARVVPGSGRARLVSLSSAGRSRNIADVIEAVLAGRLVPRAIMPNGVCRGSDVRLKGRARRSIFAIRS